MTYLDRLKSILIAEADHRLYGAIPADHVHPPPSQADFTVDDCYLRIWLTDIYLAHRRVLFQTRSPLVHANCRFLYRGAEQEVPLVAGPTQIQGMADALDRVVNLNYRLLGPVPFRGGVVELLLALVATEVADHGDHLLDLLGALSLLTGQGEFKLALSLIEPIKRGVEGFFGLGDAQVQLGLHDTFSASATAPNRLAPGYRVVIDTSDRAIPLSSLWVKDGRLYAGADLESATLFTGADYMLLYLERLDRRDDIASMVSIQQSWDEAILKARGNNDQELDLAFDAFKGLVLISPDLIWPDQVHLVNKLRERIEAIRALGGRLGLTATALDTSLATAVTEEQAETASPLPDRAEIISMSWRPF